LKNKNHYRIIIAIVFTNGQTWDRVNTLLDRNGSDFQRRAQSSGSRVFGDFGDPKKAKRNAEKHRHTPINTETHGKKHRVQGAERLGVQGGHTWCLSGFPSACLPPPGKTRHRGFSLSYRGKRGNAEQLQIVYVSIQTFIARRKLRAETAALAAWLR